jgi:hypothetical protein
MTSRVPRSEPAKDCGIAWVSINVLQKFGGAIVYKVASQLTGAQACSRSGRPGPPDPAELSLGLKSRD